MKAYDQSSASSVSMSDDPKLRQALEELLASESIRIVIETGTHLGTGSTRIICESFPRHKPPKRFYSIEVNRYLAKAAATNLRQHSFVNVLWGRTVRLRDALDFIHNDEALSAHDAYPDVYIDDPVDPVGFYERELAGASNDSSWTKRIRTALEHLILEWRENLLERLILKHKDEEPLIVLDSAGGIGYLEFKIVMERLRDRAFYLLLDDIHHLKHFRSVMDIRSDPRFEVLGSDEWHGWLLAKHSADR